MPNGIPFSLSISYDTFLHVYKGEAKYVITKAFDGRTVRFPAEVLKPFLTRDGIRGKFVIFFDDRNKFQSIQQIRE